MKQQLGILLIDDSFIDRAIVSKNMEISYPEIPYWAFSSAREALDELMEAGIPDVVDHVLILLDIYMPEMNGFAFVDEFAFLPETVRNRITLFMLSSSIDGGDMENVEKRQLIKRFVSKPLTAVVLRSVIEETRQLLGDEQH